MGVREFTENELKVHFPHEANEVALTNRADLARELDTKRREIFQLVHAIDERELELINEQAGVEHGSATARKEAIKDAIAADADLRTKRLAIADLRADEKSIEDDMKGCDLAIQSNIARMHELGGLLHLYAATKMGPSRA